jgi:hypothetical protein
LDWRLQSLISPQAQCDAGAIQPAATPKFHDLCGGAARAKTGKPAKVFLFGDRVMVQLEIAMMS